MLVRELKKKAYLTYLIIMWVSLNENTFYLQSIYPMSKNNLPKTGMGPPTAKLIYFTKKINLNCSKCYTICFYF